MSLTDKSVRYDRQVRLWGEAAQAALENANVCLINATPVGTEALKGLILPGVGSYTILDGAKITERDLGNNFFVCEEQLGASRAKVTCELLGELNELVKGNFLEEDPVQLINEKIDWFNQFTIVIATGLAETSLLKLSSHLDKQKIPLVRIGNNGFIGILRVQSPEHTIVELKPDHTLQDLRITKPWPELENFANSINLDESDETLHAHIPWGVVLIQMVNRWKKEHSGNLPKGRNEQNEFKASVNKLIRTHLEENFSEALKELKYCWSLPGIPSNIRDLFNDEKCLNLNENSTTFWILVRALKEFADAEGVLPLRGSIPDMISTPNWYITLQNIYFEKATKDSNTIFELVQNLLSKIGRPSTSITLEEVKNYCKNAANLTVLRYRTVEQENTPDKSRSEYFDGVVAGDEHNNFRWYITFRAYDRFISTHNRVPGNNDDEVETDIPLLKGIAASIASDYGVELQSLDESIHEFCRYGGSDLHNVAAILGNIASQEVFKLITHQYTPLFNTLIFNAINSSSVSFEA